MVDRVGFHLTELDGRPLTEERDEGIYRLKLHRGRLDHQAIRDSEAELPMRSPFGLFHGIRLAA